MCCWCCAVSDGLWVWLRLWMLPAWCSMRVWCVESNERKLILRMYRSSELSRTRNDPSGNPARRLSAVSKSIGPQYHDCWNRKQKKTSDHCCSLFDFSIFTSKESAWNVFSWSYMKPVSHNSLQSKLQFLIVDYIYCSMHSRWTC